MKVGTPKQHNLRSRSSPSANCPVAFWRILSVEEPFSYLTPASILYAYKQDYLFLLLIFLLVARKPELHSLSYVFTVFLTTVEIACTGESEEQHAGAQHEGE